MIRGSNFFVKNSFVDLFVIDNYVLSTHSYMLQKKKSEKLFFI